MERKYLAPAENRIPVFQPVAKPTELFRLLLALSEEIKISWSLSAVVRKTYIRGQEHCTILSLSLSLFKLQMGR
jgi:hypothetical protein